MSASLGGSMFIFNGEKQDYCYLATIACLVACCDKVVVVNPGSDDGTTEKLKTLTYPNLEIINLPIDMWLAQHGREKLSYFHNIAIEALGTEYNLSLQADEVLHESCFPAVREAVEFGMPAYLVRRINLWSRPELMLNVEQARKPCSTEIVRLAKNEFRHVDDGESLAATHIYIDFLDKIRCYHMGFIRDQVKHLEKIKYMQDQVFEIQHDKRVDGVASFDPWIYFDRDKDVIPIQEPLPIFVQDWVRERYPDYRP